MGFTYRWNRKGEEIEDTAMREVEEETENQLRLQNSTKKRITFSSVTGNKLKITHWFEMDLVLRVRPGSVRRGH
jgi:hypothetical protein